ncbi:MAG TPA: LamG domain-containing protein [Polyangia bacterium]|nr:LamG domain-containing protein [Polyangia bacterium]
MTPDLRLIWLPLLALGAASCLTPEGYDRNRADAGSQGGSSASGGAPGTGGTMATGGAVATGGVVATGGTRATGGVIGTGASPSTGGSATSGATLLADGFENGTAQWLTSGPGTATVKTDGSKVYDLADPMSKVFLAAAGDVAWTNVIVQARVKIVSWAGSSSSDYAGLCARLADADNYTCVTLRGDGKVALREDVAGSSGSLGSSVTANLTAGTWYKVTLQIAGNSVTASVDDMPVLPKSGDTAAAPASASGGIGLVVDNAEAEFDDLKVTVP